MARVGSQRQRKQTNNVLIISVLYLLHLPKAVSFIGAGNISAGLGFICIGTAQALVDTCSVKYCCIVAPKCTVPGAAQVPLFN